MGLHQSKTFCTAGETFTRVKRQPKDLEKIFPSYSCVRELVSSINKEFKILNTKRTNNLVSK
jgi:hypothetical protein